MTIAMHVQGHRGARGLAPENTLPGFEIALDLGVSSVETDVRLTRDGVPVLFHDTAISPSLCSLLPGRNAPLPETQPRVVDLTWAQLQAYRVDRNPDPQRFPRQRPTVTPRAAKFMTERGRDPLGIPSLAEFLAFVGEFLAADAQIKSRLAQLAWHVELKSEPWTDGGQQRAELVQAVVETMRAADMVERCCVRAFDHRLLRLIKELEPGLATGVLISGTTPCDPVAMVRAAGADWYFPEYRWVDAELLRQLAQVGIGAQVWTVNDPRDWQRLAAIAVSGLDITTDVPDKFFQGFDPQITQISADY
jgi:glycerophosphoryl diester phosphodiesterase